MWDSDVNYVMNVKDEQFFAVYGNVVCYTIRRENFNAKRFKPENHASGDDSLWR